MAITDFDRGGSIVFFVPLGLLNMIGLMLVLLEGYHLHLAGDPSGVATMFTALVFLVVYFGYHAIQFFSTSAADDPEVERYWTSQLDTPQQLSMVLVIGFVLWYGVASLQAGAAHSVVADVPVLSTVEQGIEQLPAMPQSVLMSSATAEIDPAYARFANSISAPFTEEAFFLGGLPLALLLLMGGLGVKNRMVKYGVMLVMVSALFASFHVASATFSVFWIAAFAFSMIVRGISIFDYVGNIVPGIALLVPFAIGGHIANNVVSEGGIVDFARVVGAEPLLLLLTVAATGIYLFWAYQGFQNAMEWVMDR